LEKSKVTLDIMHGKERTSTGQITSPILVAQHLTSTSSRKEWTMDHADMKIGDTVTYRLASFWSPKEETHMRPGHNWLLKFGKVAGSMSCVDKEFKLVPGKYEEYKGLRFYNDDCTLVV